MRSGDGSHLVGPQAGVLAARILTRDTLAEPVDGPVVFDEFDTTVVVPPGWRHCF